jgi:UDP-N-acetylglucosamine:LPS N-acetylglucosamine transferase
MLAQSELTRASLLEKVAALFGNPDRLVKMANAVRALSHPHAAHDIAAIAARLAGSKPALD